MTLSRILLTAVLTLAAGCGFGSYPDKDGEYAKQFPKTPLSNQICQVDEDCRVTRYRDGSCCPEPCNKEPHVFNKDTFESMRAHQKEICKDADFTCEVNQCTQLDIQRNARCTDGHCTIEKTRPEATDGKTKKLGKNKAQKAKAKRNKPGKTKVRPGKRKVQKRP